MRRLAVCADDFGMSLAVSRAIAGLARRARLDAVSCLTTGERWPAAAPMLAELAPAVSRGLHFNLTEGAPLSPELRAHWPRLPALPRLIVMAHLGRLPLAAIAREWQAQWRGFVDATGQAPGHVDGHQHVHHLPGVRDIVLAGVSALPGPVAVRNTGHVPGPGFAFKRMLIERTGGTALERQLRERGIEHNRALLGVYDFRDPDYRRRMQRWLAAAPADGGLLFCHPGAADAGEDGPPDPIAAARLREAEYLGSAAFEDDLAAAGVALGPAWTRPPACRHPPPSDSTPGP